MAVFSTGRRIELSLIGEQTRPGQGNIRVLGVNVVTEGRPAGEVHDFLAVTHFLGPMDKQLHEFHCPPPFPPSRCCLSRSMTF